MDHQDIKDIKDLQIAIVGGGPSGLGLARLLQFKGCKNVKIYERSKDRYCRLQGSTIDLHWNLGQKLIRAAQLEKEFAQFSRPEGECYTFADKNGNICSRKPYLKILGKRPEIDRGDLRDILLDSLKENTVEWDCHFKSLVHLDNGQIKLSFNDGEKEAIADLVIGCDGINSKVRRYLTNDQFKPEYTGITMIEGEVEDAKNQIPEIYNLVCQGLMFVIENGIVGLAQQKSDGNIVFSFAQRVPQDWVKTMGFDFSSNSNSMDVKSYLKNKLIPDWSPIFHKLIDCSMTPFKPRVLYRAPLNQNWKTQKNITIIGDAAHSFSPMAGLGCNLALYDSYELATILTSVDHQQQTSNKSFNDIDADTDADGASINTTTTTTNGLLLFEKLQKFEKLMLNRWRVAAKETMENEQSIFIKNTSEAIRKRLGLYYTLDYYFSLGKFYNYFNYFTDLLSITK